MRTFEYKVFRGRDGERPSSFLHFFFLASSEADWLLLLWASEIAASRKMYYFLAFFLHSHSRETTHSTTAKSWVYNVSRDDLEGREGEERAEK